MSMVCRKVNGTGALPSPRSGHSTTVYGESKLVVFGGWGPSATSHDDLYILDLKKMTWSKPITCGHRPPARGGHSANLINDNTLVVFGGHSNLELFRLDDVYTIDLDTMVWKKQEVKGDIPRPRGQHACCQIGDRIFMFGGHDGCGGCFNDVSVLDTTTFKWSTVPVEGTPPSPSGAATATAVGSIVLIFGGWNGEDYSNDVFSLDTESNPMRWEKLDVMGRVPSGRAAHSATCMDSRLFVFGGSEGKYRLDDCHVFIPQSKRWFTPEIYGRLPGAHSCHTATYANGTIYLFGGFNGKRRFNDMYEVSYEYVGR